MVAGTSVKGATTASVRLLGVVSACQCEGGNERLRRSSGLCSNVSARAQGTTVVADKTGEGAEIASVRWVGVG